MNTPAHTPTPWAIIELPDQCDILANAARAALAKAQP